MRRLECEEMIARALRIRPLIQVLKSLKNLPRRDDYHAESPKVPTSLNSAQPRQQAKPVTTDGYAALAFELLPC